MSVFSCPHCGTLLEVPETTVAPVKSKDPRGDRLDALDEEAAADSPRPLTAERAGRNVVREREARGWSQQQLAKAVDMLPGDLSNIETGRRPAGPWRAQILAEYLGLPIEDILMDVRPHIPRKKNK